MLTKTDIKRLRTVLRDDEPQPTDEDVGKRFLLRALEACDSALSEAEMFRAYGLPYDAPVAPCGEEQRR